MKRRDEDMIAEAYGSIYNESAWPFPYEKTKWNSDFVTVDDERGGIIRLPATQVGTRKVVDDSQFTVDPGEVPILMKGVGSTESDRIVSVFEHDAKKMVARRKAYILTDEMMSALMKSSSEQAPSAESKSDSAGDVGGDGVLTAPWWTSRVDS